MSTRMLKLTVSVVLICILIDCRADDNELRLIRHLLANYDASVRPAQNASHAMQVIFGMSLHLIIDVDERGQILTTNCWLTQQWNDTHLKWNASDYGGISVVRIPYHRVWRPDIILYNNADAQYGSSVINTNVIVSDSGQVVWLSHGIFRSSCDINVEFFPFDVQSCKMKWASWTYDGYQIDLVKQTEVGDLSNYQTNGEFDLVGMEAIYHEEYYSCCPEPYPDITYIIKMRRRPLFYVFNLILPCILINGIALLVFYVPAESGEKVTLGISSLLSMTVFLMTIRESLPPTEKTPLISLYYGVSICLVSFASGLSVVTLNLHHRGLRGTEVPYVLRKVVLGGLARLVLLSFDAPKIPRNVDNSRTTCTCNEGAKRRAKTSAAKTNVAPSWRHASATSAGPNGLSTISTSGVRLDPESVEKFTRRSPDPLDFLGLGPPSPRCYTRRPAAGRPASVEIAESMERFLSTGGGLMGSASVGAGPSTAPTSNIESYEQRLSQMLTRVTAAIERNETRLEDQDRRDAIQLEWKQVALVCDRTLLLVFFVVTTVATCLILMSSPYGP